MKVMVMMRKVMMIVMKVIKYKKAAIKVKYDATKHEGVKPTGAYRVLVLVTLFPGPHEAFCAKKDCFVVKSIVVVVNFFEIVIYQKLIILKITECIKNKYKRGHRYELKF